MYDNANNFDWGFWIYVIVVCTASLLIILLKRYQIAKASSQFDNKRFPLSAEEIRNNPAALVSYRGRFTAVNLVSAPSFTGGDEGGAIPRFDVFAVCPTGDIYDVATFTDELEAEHWARTVGHYLHVPARAGAVLLHSPHHNETEIA